MLIDVTPAAPFARLECPRCHATLRAKCEFGPYRLKQRLAEGGMSMVFVAEDVTLQRDVAIKILSEAYSQDEKRMAAFESEARVTASVVHPHVVKVFKTGRAFGRFYIAMELLPGGHFEQQINERGAIPESETLKLALQVAEGLRAAHAVGLLHRDVKPGNILIDAAGEAKLVDFGLALMTKGGKARPDELWATPYYVPPETIEGAEEDFRSDLYAFGATFYHALAGVPSCEDSTMQTTQLREAKRHVRPLSAVCPQLSLETLAWVETAMAYEPAARFSSYDALIESIKAAMLAQAQPQTKREPAAFGKKRRKRQRQQQRAWIAAGVGMLAVVSLWWLSRASEKPATPAASVAHAPVVVDRSVDEMAQRYSAARQAMLQHQAMDAQRLLLRMRDDVRVEEPTRSFCGLEALLCQVLAGRAWNETQLVDELRSHLEQSKLDARWRRPIEQWLECLSEPGVATLPSGLEGEDMQVLRGVLTFATALRQWDQGLLDQAVVSFQAVDDMSGLEKNILPAYVSWAQVYLADAAWLQQHRAKMQNLTKDQARGMLGELDQWQAQLRTRGRAGFTVQEWRRWLEQQAGS